jgi:DNA-binding transcriptional MerR regulator
MDSRIPDKLYFKIGEVANIVGVKPHVLRYWESEFSRFRPTKSSKNQRLYRRQDIELVLKVKDLLYNQGFTIAGAKKKLQGESGKAALEKAETCPKSERETALLDEIRSDLIKLRTALRGRLFPG